MENDIGTILLEMGGGAGAAMVLTGILRRTWEIKARFLPITALVSGFIVSVLLSLINGFDTSALVVGFFAGLSAVGAHQTVTNTIDG